jgi:hypothetical protein
MNTTSSEDTFRQNNAERVELQAFFALQTERGNGKMKTP